LIYGVTPNEVRGLYASQRRVAPRFARNDTPINQAGDRSKQVKDDRTPYLAQIKAKIEQLGGLESPENFARKIGEEQAQYILDGEDPF
jgi:hypothetical protein